jgi:hypothetical protein
LANTFVFFDLRSSAIFKADILPERWQSIRPIEIYTVLYRKDDADDAVDAVRPRSHLQLEAWLAACTVLGLLSYLRTLKNLIGSARYLDNVYLARGIR